MVADEDVDTETLQAQIDMSMSFVHNLVTSWIHPVHAAQLRTAATHAERTLDEELRRPARLGVGAPIPGIPPAARDAAKLKHRLSKASEKRPTSDQPLSQPHSTSDEEEKGRATKRKIRGDPFAMEKSKKKRKISEVLQIGPTPGTSQHRALDRTVAIKHEVSSGVGSWKHPKQETWAKRGKKLGIDLESRTLSGTKSHQLPVTSPLAVNPPFHLTSPAAHVPLRSGEASDSALRSTGAFKTFAFFHATLTFVFSRFRCSAKHSNTASGPATYTFTVPCI
ncbi:hypothetical protein F5I97DRAFT_1861488 [Phlebopus sp. FC_14]|nr:hypothetical protein F5I97DRAFT_1861488 [Phlebopus sp. FC_14]